MLAVAGGKGGSGKTTTTLGLASALGGPALTVDAGRDMPNLHTMAGVRRPVDATFGAPVREPSVRSHPTDSTVSILLAPAGTDDDALERWPRTAAGDGRRAVVDCLAGVGPDTAVSLRIADGVVTMSPLCASALRGVAKTAAMARALGTLVIGCVIFRSRVTPKAVPGLVGASVLGTVPEELSPVLTRPAVRVTYRRIADKMPRKK